MKRAAIYYTCTCIASIFTLTAHAVICDTRVHRVYIYNTEQIVCRINLWLICKQRRSVKATSVCFSNPFLFLRSHYFIKRSGVIEIQSECNRLLSAAVLPS